MATTSIHAPGGSAAVQFLKDRFGIEWGPDVLGITQDGVTAKQSEGSDGLMEITLVAKCTRADVEEFVRLMWTKEDKSND